ncbi:tetratricopeptide repeat protein [Lysobacter pythonis]|uniref:protein O-GlcNAc transferase n=1 Tax=Solilutibacter pythonis TaxID=2483112 RepID=A0A3M2HFV0_9GAMM|nr:tetratricopeptide repeat protein [Lysobacter pythonis]RMH88606.1 tetratricopeptide repeat protein [Lysobacter pythonis]
MDKATHARQLHQAGKLGQAVTFYRQALQKAPHDHQLMFDLGIALLQDGRPDDAGLLLAAIPPQADSHPEAMLALATVLRTQQQFSDGLHAAKAAAQLLPNHPLAWLMLGSLYVLNSQHAIAEPALRKALQLAPDFAEAWHYLGESLQAQRRYHEAATAYHRSAQAQPTDIINIGICAELSGDLPAARAYYLESNKLTPGRLDILVRLANVCAQMCHLQEVEDICATVAQLTSHPYHEFDANHIEPFPLSYLPLPEAFKRDALTTYAARVVKRAEASCIELPSTPPAHMGNRIRIGYLSPDLGNHAVGQLLRQHFAAHQRDGFEVFAYSLHDHQDEIAREIAIDVEHFVMCESMSAAEIAQRIHRDGIDLLIDLGGYTLGAKPEVLAMRPAKHQLGWLGFIHGQQAPWLDGIILDRYCAPASIDWPYRDRIIWIDSPMFPAWKPAQAKADRAKFGFPHDSPILASFNNSYKLDTTLLSAWVRILQGAPKAHLLVFMRNLPSRSGFLEAWHMLGGDLNRLQFVEAVSFDEQLQRAASCDLFLDAFRYQAGATAIFSIAAGLPLLTVAGNTPAARMSAGINHYLGMDELLCNDTEQYIRRATTLANNSEQLATVRQQLALQVSKFDLLSPRRCAAEIERISSELIAGSVSWITHSQPLHD